MLLLFWIVFCLIAGSLLLLPLALRMRETYSQFSGSRLVTCPENQHAAAVNIDAAHAAMTGVDGCPKLRLCDCTRWPERSQCDRGCLSQALRTQPYKPRAAAVRTKQIYHLPIALAAFIAWYLGAVWHSQYLFRARWMDAVGLSRDEVKQAVWWVWPHLLTAAIWLLFAYGVACLLVVCHRKGVLQGVGMSMLLCAALVLTSWAGLAQLPHELFAVESGYVVVAALCVGAITGGLYGRPLLPSD